MGEGLVLRKGQTWELHSAVGLEEIFEHFFGNFAYLRNTETGGVAKITQRWLYEGEKAKPRSIWKLVD